MRPKRWSTLARAIAAAIFRRSDQTNTPFACSIVVQFRSDQRRSAPISAAVQSRLSNNWLLAGAGTSRRFFIFFPRVGGCAVVINKRAARVSAGLLFSPIYCFAKASPNFRCLCNINSWCKTTMEPFPAPPPVSDDEVDRGRIPCRL
jgi:hypothetical protein